MVTLSATSSIVNAANAAQQVDYVTRVIDQLDLSRGARALVNSVQAVSVDLELPVLGRNGDSRTTVATVSINGESTPKQFGLRFKKLSGGVVQVDITSTEAPI